ncbi:hypothetical protein ACA910_008729 [Epithemia clementina (nom. ined.)]
MQIWQAASITKRRTLFAVATVSIKRSPLQQPQLHWFHTAWTTAGGLASPFRTTTTNNNNVALLVGTKRLAALDARSSRMGSSRLGGVSPVTTAIALERKDNNYGRRLFSASISETTTTTTNEQPTPAAAATTTTTTTAAAAATTTTEAIGTEVDNTRWSSGDDLVESINVLMAKDIGTFQSDDWDESYNLLTAFVKNYQLRTKIHHVFALLDRLVLQKQEEAQIPKSNHTRSSYPWEVGLLANILRKWRTMFKEPPATTPTTDSEPPLPLPPLIVLDKVHAYLQAKLFDPPHADLNHLILTTMQVMPTRDPQEMENMLLQHMMPPEATDNSSSSSIIDPEKLKILTLMQPNGACYQEALMAWRSAKNPQKCDDLLRLFCHKLVHNKNKIEPSLLDTKTFHTVIQAWSDTIPGSSTFRKGQQTNFTVAPTPLCEQDLQAAERAMSIFELLKQTNWKYPDLLFPDVYLFHSVMNIWYKCRRPDKVEALFQELKKLHQSTGRMSLNPDFGTYRLRTSAWAGANRNDGVTHPQQATMALMEMIALPLIGRRIDQKPAKIDFDMVLRSWARSHLPQAGMEAEKVLRTMTDFALQNPPYHEAGLTAPAQQRMNCFPDAISLNYVLSCHLRSNPTNPSAGAPAVYRLFQTFQSQFPFVRLDLEVYTTVLMALVKSRDALAYRRAEEIFAFMKQQQQQRVMRLDSAVYQLMIELAMFQQKPTRAEELFQEMKQQQLEPTHHCHVFRTKAWTVEDHPEQMYVALKDWTESAAASRSSSQHFRGRRKRIDPPRSTDWNELLHAWIKWGTRMPSFSSSSSQPNNNHVDDDVSKEAGKPVPVSELIIQHREKALQQAELALREMSQRAKSTEFSLCAPTARTYAILISGHAKMGLPKSGKEALRLLDEQRTVGRPTLLTYNDVIQALCRSNESPESVEADIRKLLDELKSVAMAQKDATTNESAKDLSKWTTAKTTTVQHKEIKLAFDKIGSAIANYPSFSLELRKELVQMTIELRNLFANNVLQ